MSKPFVAKKNVKENDPLEVFYRKGVMYEFTLNPKEQHGRMSHPRRLRHVVADTLTCMKGIWGLKFTLYPEISEPRFGNSDRGCIARIHFHGFIEFTGHSALGVWLLDGINLIKRYGDFQVNACRLDYWDKYIKKQETLMRILCKKYSCPYLLSDRTGSFDPDKPTRCYFELEASGQEE